MAKRLDYEDALRILGAHDSEVLDLAERLTDGGLGLVGVPDLFGMRGALVSRGRRALEGMRGRLKGESRRSRTEKIEAAYRILVITSFFEAADEAFDEVGMPFGLDDLEITSEEQYAVLGRRLLGATGAPPLPSLTRPAADGPSVEWPLLQTGALGAFGTFVCGLAVAERHGLTEDHPLITGMQRELSRRVRARFEENVLRLGADIPEFGMWMHRADHERTRREIGTGLVDLHEQLARIGSGRPMSRRREELAAAYQAVLERPVLRSDDAPAGLVFPSLREAYIAPRGRVTTTRTGSTPAHDDWWRDVPVEDDLPSITASLITHPRSTEHPIVVLGHPGAGKSKFTEMIAARLPAEDFLPIRVELRSVSPNAPLYVQIEEGLQADLHTSVSWRDLADDADGALPVIILDGFDELLQATGVDRSDYLERVQEFQRQQEAMGRPVVVIVTSRTLVADRTRFPTQTTVLRLEPFDEARIGAMLRVWNAANEHALHERGLSGLEPAMLLRYGDLAEQPLLLLMLLIYDTHDNALLRASDTLSHGELYERLLTMFARREVDKHSPGLGDRDLERAIEDELRRLEVAALAMFTRGRQSVHAEELDEDLAVLMPEAALVPEHTDLHGRIAPAHQVLGRFFFVHEARSRTTDGTRSAFEFLHATFGEYLVARMVVAALDELVEDRARASRRRSRSFHLDDGELYALASFAAFAGRDRVVSFLEELLARRVEEDPGLGEELQELLLELFREAPFPAPHRSFVGYAPVRLPVTSREARYTANLVTLLILVAEEPIPLTGLHPDADEPWHAWRRTVSLWRSLPSSQWFGLVDLLRMRHLGYWKGERPHTVLSRERGEPVNVGECVGFELRADVSADPTTLDPYEVTVPYATVISRLLRTTALRANGTASRLALLLTPYLRYVSEDLGTWYVSGDQKSWVETHEVLRLRLEPIDRLPAEQAEERLHSYGRLVFRTEVDGVVLTVLRQALEDLRSWPRHLGSDTHRALRTMIQKALRGVRRGVDTPPELWESFQRLRNGLLPLLGDDDPDHPWSVIDHSAPLARSALAEPPDGSAGH
ncbi:NACHT domain-containing NTPase [Nocardiopsis sp. MG754419]|uniref:NACHT domain-containing protein n=1 Tax=Nocardiopsis sp. MG754419 TaxID=2259865 RepID=UPI002011CFB5|nr:ATP-binding protein [Nocardiopsis sp. MG754419]